MALAAARYRIRRAWQRLFTDLPVGTRPFSELVPDLAGPAPPATLADRPFSGLLRRQGPFAVPLAPTTYAAGSGRWRCELRPFISAQPAWELMALAGGCIYGEAGMVYEPRSRHFVAETVDLWIDPLPSHPAFAAPRFPRREELSGVSFAATTLGGNAFYHFLVDVVPKLLWARDLLPACDQILVAGHGEEWKRRWLAFLGVPPRVSFLPPLAHVRCEQLLFTGRFNRHFEPSPDAVRLLRAATGAAGAATGAEALWLDRRDAPARSAAWESAFTARLPELTPVAFSSLPPEESVRRCAAARVLVGLHGSAFTNMLFCAPGALVIEIFLEPGFPWYARLAQACGHRHVAIRAESDGSGAEALAAEIRRQLTAYPS